MSEPEERIFTRSVASQLAAGTVIETARKAGFIDGPIIVASELAESEKALIVKILAAIRERGSTELDSDTVSSMFTFVFARAAEAVCSCLNHREFEIEMLGLLTKHFNLISLVEVTGLEPVTPCLQSRCSTS